MHYSLWDNVSFNSSLACFNFKASCNYVAHADLKLAVYSRLALNSQSFCLSLQNVDATDMCFQTSQIIIIIIITIIHLPSKYHSANLRGFRCWLVSFVYRSGSFCFFFCCMNKLKAKDYLMITFHSYIAISKHFWYLLSQNSYTSISFKCRIIWVPSVTIDSHIAHLTWSFFFIF